MTQTIITFDSPEMGNAVQLKLNEGDIHWADCKNVSIDYIPGAVLVIGNLISKFGEAGYYRRNNPDATFVPADDFLANPWLVPGWDDGKKCSMKSYKERQELSDLKVGDKVRIIRSCGKYESGWKDSWSDSMNSSIGQFAYITAINEQFGMKLSINSWNYPYFVLEKVESSSCDEKPITPILKGNTMQLFQVAVLEKPEDSKGKRKIILNVESIIADDAKIAELEALKLIDLEKLDMSRLEVLVRPFLKQ